MSAWLDDKQIDDGNELWMTVQWGRPFISGGSEKILRKEISNEIYCSTGKNKLSEIANPSKNLLLGLKFDPPLCVFSSSDKLKTLINH